MMSRLAFSVIVCVLAFWIPRAGHAQQISGVSQVQAEFQSLPANSRIRVIADVIVDPSLVPTLGMKNATARSVEAAAASLAQIGIPIIQPIVGTNRVVLEITNGELAQLNQLGRISSIEIDKLNEPFLTTLTPAIGATTVHTNYATGVGTAVAIIDSGVERTHQFLGGRVTAEACFSSTTSAGATSTCPNGSPTQTGLGAAAPCAGLCAHGTHVAGIAAGSNANMRGLAPAANIVAINVFSRFSTAANCNGAPPCIRAYDSDIERALIYIRDNLLPGTSISSVNLSLGGGAYPSECANNGVGTRMQELRDRGVAVVVASGNNSCNNTGCTNAISSPACMKAAYSVGATNNSNTPNTVQSFSNSASFLDVLAPGSPVFSSVPGGTFSSMGGTSMAAPAVAGLIAALRSKFYVGVDEIETTIKQSGVSVTDPRNGVVTPRIAALAAYNMLEASRPAGAFIWMKDTWSDTGAEPDPRTAGQPMSASPFIWIRNQDDGAQHLHEHQNPEYGQPNYIYVKILNTGKTQGAGTLSLFVTPATPNPNLGSNWIRITDAAITMPPRNEVVYKFPWTTVPKPGHYCLLAKWTDAGGDTNLTFTNLDAAVRNSNDMIWKNINVIDLLKNEYVATEFDIYKGASGGQANFVIEVTGSRTRNAVLDFNLPLALASKLRDEPTLSRAQIRIDEVERRANVRLPLSDGVYYFPMPDNAAPEKVTVPVAFKILERGDKNMDFKVNVLQVRDIADHKKTGGGEVGSITYMIQ